jgi:hypothetical protein
LVELAYINTRKPLENFAAVWFNFKMDFLQSIEIGACKLINCDIIERERGKFLETKSAMYHLPAVTVTLQKDTSMLCKETGVILKINKYKQRNAPRYGI